jgi:Tfp pilus assembly protein PilF
MWYRAQLEQNPQNTDSRAGLAMTYADAGQFDTARSTLFAETELDDETHFTLRTRLVEAYILEREGRLMDALAVYQRVLDANPADGTDPGPATPRPAKR